MYILKLFDSSNSGVDDNGRVSDIKIDSQSKSNSIGNESNVVENTDPNKYTSSDVIKEGIIAGQRIAKISVVTLLAIGIVEIATGYFSGSVVATADGMDSISDALISFIVLLGLRISNKPADKKFHFGYHKVESFAALIASIGMIVIGVIIFYNSYQALIHPHDIEHPYLTMAVLAGASAMSLHRAFQMRNIANKYNLLSLKTDARNSIKDGSASVIGFFSILIATQFGVIQMDSIGGMIIAGYIFSVAYISVRKSSLILVDSWQNPKLTTQIRKILLEQFRENRVRQVFLRSSGMVDQAEIHIDVNENMQLKDVEMLSLEVEKTLRAKFPSIERISIIPHSNSSNYLDARRNILRNIKLTRPVKIKKEDYK